MQPAEAKEWSPAMWESCPQERKQCQVHNKKDLGLTPGLLSCDLRQVVG